MRILSVPAWLALGSSLIGCGVDQEAAGSAELTVEIKLRDASGIATVRAELRREGRAESSVTLVPILPGSLTVQTTFHSVREGQHLLALRASTDRGVACAGRAEVDLKRGDLARVLVPLLCQGPPGGKLPLGGGEERCPVITSVFASPAVVDVRSGEPILLEGLAQGPRGDEIAYLWSAAEGRFDVPNDRRAQYGCAAVGPVRLTLSATTGPACGDSEFLDVVCSDGSECGDGIVGEREKCDPPNDWNCDSDCQILSDECGNGIVQAAERCDPPDQKSCDNDCQLIICGDAKVRGDEECDPPDSVNCSADCRELAPTCGNGAVQTSEECEPPGSETCSERCTIIVCGDGKVEGLEQCDPPNGVTCDAACRDASMCGDGVAGPGEECDPPNGITCDALCRSIPVVCGNGIVQPPEECDPPHAVTCSARCTTIQCGDGVREGSEECDPPDGVRCSPSCQEIPIECGNRLLEAGEECDPPDGSDCSARCTKVRCGDGIREGSEECDPPDGALCTDQCKRRKENRCPEFAWVGAWPLRAPVGQTILAHAWASDPDADRLEYTWSLLPEAMRLGSGPSSAYLCGEPGYFGIEVGVVDSAGCRITEVIPVQCTATPEP